MLQSITKEGSALMAAIVGGESDGSYNILNGGKRFSDYSNHPYADTNKATGYGLAAGKFQFMPATWNEYKRKMNLPDFSPQSQELAAWGLAQDRYKAVTGGDLQTALEKGNYYQAGKALNKTWTSAPEGKESNSNTAGFMSRVNAYLNNTTNTPNAPPKINCGLSIFCYGSKFGNVLQNTAANMFGGETVPYEETEAGKAYATEKSWFESAGNRIGFALTGAILLTIGLVKMRL